MAIELRRFEFKLEPIQPPKQSDVATNIAELTIQGIDLAINNPEKAKDFAKACMAIGAVGVGIWALTELLTNKEKN
jgi:hypothetical protein